MAGLGGLLLRGLLPGAGPGLVLVHCERAGVECCDNIDHHHAALHRWLQLDPVRCVQGRTRSQLQCQIPRFISAAQELFRPISPSDEPRCCSSENPPVKMDSLRAISFPYPNSIWCSAHAGHQGQLIIARLCYR